MAVSSAMHLPALFLPCPGQPSIPFDTWMKIFDNYMLVIHAEGDAWPDKRKRATLLHCLGAEGQRLFYSMPDTGDSYASAVTALKKHFTPTVNVVVERHKFRQRAQLPQESITDYVNALRELLATCDFGDKANEMLRDQLIEKASCPRVRERLLMQTDGVLTLDRAITLSCQVESAMAHAQSLDTNPALPVQAVKSKPFRAQKGREGKKDYKGQKPKGSSCCYRCGSGDHLANSPGCPAAKVTCKQCNKKGHYARVCRSSKKETVQEVESELPELTVLYLQDESVRKDRIMCRVTMRTKESAPYDVDLVVDTGSSASIIPRQLYCDHFHSTPLVAPPAQLLTYSKSKIQSHGCMPATVHHDGTTVPAQIYVVKAGTPILGMDLFMALNLRVVGNKVITKDMPAAPSAPVCQIEAVPPTLGRAKAFVHRVKVKDDVTPVQQKLRRLPYSVKEAVTQELDRLQTLGVIEKIDASPWVSPIVVTQKKTGGIRMCVDLREPNDAIVIDCYPLPHMEDLFSELRGSKVFSTIDLATAYYQVPLHEDSRDLTAFITHEGLFRFCRVPYGLASAPSAFQKMMATILKGMPGVQAYLDDLIIYGKDVESHNRHLRAVLAALKDAGLELNKDKCHFNRKSLPFLRHVVTAEGLLPDDGHVSAILNAPAPKDATTLRSFLGLTSWYSKFVPHYSSLVEGMRACLRSEQDFEWTDAAQQAFEQVKKHIANSPALAMFDPALPTLVSTDASDYGLGAVLAQIHPDQTERTVAFASRSLTATERKYSIVEKEALACVWAVERWRTFLWGTRFTLRTDHQALTTLLATKGLGRAGMRIARWSARLLC